MMVDPVIAADGHTYERAAIQQWLQTHPTSPVTSCHLITPALCLMFLPRQPFTATGMTSYYKIAVASCLPVMCSMPGCTLPAYTDTHKHDVIALHQ